MTPLVLHLPWPPLELSPNARPHWRAKARATAQYRRDCWLTGRVAYSAPPNWAFADDLVIARVTFVVPDKRRHDLDNCMAMLKPAWDGLVDAGVLVDDDSEHLKLAAPEMRYEKGRKYVEVTLT